MTQSPTHRERITREERREQLLTAARLAFAEQGYHATSMDDVAARAGVSKPVLYRHFDSKLALYVALATEVADDLSACVRGALEPGGTIEEQVRAATHAFFGFVDRPGGAYRIVFGSDLVREPEVYAVVRRSRRELTQAVADSLVKETGLPEAQCLVLGRAVIGTAQAAALGWGDDRGNVGRDEAAELVARVLGHGLRAVARD